MRVKELKSILKTDTINIFANNIDHFFERDGLKEDEYIFVYDEKVNMWEIYGEREIKQITCMDENIIIDVK